MKVLLVSFYDESSMGMRSVGARLLQDGHDVHFLHLNPFRYPFVPVEDVETRAHIMTTDPLTARDPQPLGDVYIWKSPLTDADLATAVEHVAALAPDAVGMGVVMGMDPAAAQVTRALEARLPGIAVVWGGVLPTLTPEVAARHASVVCIADGEEPMAAWCRDPSRTDIPGLWVRRGDETIRNAPAPPPPLDSLPPPLYAHQEHTLMDGALCRRTVDDTSIAGNLYVFMASRGCRFDCSYCLSGRLRKAAGRPPRNRRSVGRFLEEIRSAATRFQLPQPILFWDDIFTDDLEWLEEFAPRYAREVGIPFNCQTHPDRCPPRALELLKLAGIEQLAIGLESGSSRVLRQVYGRQPDAHKVVRLAHDAVAAGISNVQVDLVTDNRYETEEDCRETLDVLLALPRPYHLEPSKLVIYPGTRLASYQGPLGGMSDRRWDSWNMLFLLTQYATVRKQDIERMARDEHVMANPEILRGIAHAVVSAHERIDALTVRPLVPLATLPEPAAPIAAAATFPDVPAVPSTVADPEEASRLRRAVRKIAHGDFTPITRRLRAASALLGGAP